MNRIWTPRNVLRAVATVGGLLMIHVSAGACGDVTSLRGGVAAPAGEHSVELVRAPSGQWMVHVDDHGRQVPVATAEGTLEVMRDGEPLRVHAMQGQPTNVLAAGTDDLRPGDRLQLVVRLPNGLVVWTHMTMMEPPPSFATRFIVSAERARQ